MVEESPAESGISEAQMVGIPHPGEEILGGKYVVERVIGVGGMGVVVSAIHKQLGQRVAIKFLSKQMQTPELVDRFIREGQACARIKSEHIASVLDVGLLESGTPYLMMEYLEGIDLDDYLGDHGAMTVEDAIDFILQACDALAVAHSQGIVHRDLKPSNLFVTERADGSPWVKVLDFGISKHGQSISNPNPKATLTRPGTMLGSPRYMSPEQLRNASNVDHRADIWAIGIVLHELIIGEPPFVADSIADLCGLVTAGTPVPIRHYKPDAPEALETAILRCIEKNPDHRFQNVAELAAALAPIAPEESQAIALRVGKILEVASTRTTKYPSSPDGSIPSRRYGSRGSGAGRSKPGSNSTDPTMARSDLSRRFGSGQVGYTTSTAAAPKRSRGLIIGFLLLLVLGGVIGGVVVLARNAPNPAAAAPPPATTPVVAAPQPPAPPPPVTAIASEPPPVATPVPVVPVSRLTTAKPAGPARPKSSAQPTAVITSSPAAPPATVPEADMLNRRR